MLRPDHTVGSIYLHRAPIDMRKQMNGLAAMVEGMQLDPCSGALFVFTNRSRNKLKILIWDRSGFVVWYKRLEKEKFHWPKCSDAVVTLTSNQLHWLLDGSTAQDRHNHNHNHNQHSAAVRLQKNHLAVGPI